MLVGEDFKRNGTNEKFETFNNVKLMIENVKCKILNTGGHWGRYWLWVYLNLFFLFSRKVKKKEFAKNAKKWICKIDDLKCKM